MILLDTNVLVHFVNAAAPEFASTRAALLALNAREPLVVVPQCLYEFWCVATRPLASNGLAFPVPFAQLTVYDLLQFFPLLPDSPALFDAWHELVVEFECSGKQAHDARIVAAMRTHGVERLLTFNGKDFERFPGVTLIDPQGMLTP